jgi:hypothetical protein
MTHPRFGVANSEQFFVKFSHANQQLNHLFSSNQVVEISCGRSHTVVCTADGQVFTFGSNDKGQLGLPHIKVRRVLLTFLSDMVGLLETLAWLNFLLDCCTGVANSRCICFFTGEYHSPFGERYSAIATRPQRGLWWILHLCHLREQ